MNITIGKKDIIWSYASQFLQFGAGLLLLPIILRMLSSSELAIWYIFLAGTTLANLLDFGFQPTIMRNVSYVFSGANQLTAKGIIKQELSETVNYNLLYSLIVTCKRIYRIISLLILLFFGTFGSYYIYIVSKGQLDLNYVLTSWGLYTISVALNFYFYYFTPLLLGRGKIKESHVTIVLSKLFFIALSFVLIINGLGLIGIAIGNICGSLVNRITSYLYFFDKDIKEQLLKAKNRIIIPLSKIIWYNSYRMGLVSLGAFMILKLNTFFVTYFLGLDIAASYGITLQLAEMLMRVSMILFTTFIPYINSQRLKNNSLEIVRTISKSYVISWGIYIIGFVFVIFLGPIFLQIISSSTELLDFMPMLFLFIIIFLEMNHSMAAGIIATKNEIPFARAAIYSGIAIALFSFLFLQYAKIGIYAIIISQGCVQLAYNNWKWPLLAFRELDLSIIKIFKNGFCELFKDFKGVIYA